MVFMLGLDTIYDTEFCQVFSSEGITHDLLMSLRLWLCMLFPLKSYWHLWYNSVY